MLRLCPDCAKVGDKQFVAYSLITQYECKNRGIVRIKESKNCKTYKTHKKLFMFSCLGPGGERVQESWGPGP